MTDTVDQPSQNNTSTVADTSDTEELEEEVQELEQQLTDLHEKFVEVQTEKKKYKQRLDRVTRENKKLKQSPMFVATVQELLAEQEILIRQHGNNQEAVTEVTAEMHEELEPQDRVAIDNSLNVVKSLTKETDVRAQVMTVDAKPDVTYTDIGGLDSQLQEVRETVELPLTNPGQFEEIGVRPPNGVLLHGPPGTGKTLIAKAVANQTDATFIQLAGSDLAQKFIGEGAKLVRNLFETAREQEPAVIFIDEIDAIGTTRTESKTSGDAEVQRTLMQLLHEMDGFEDRGDVSIIAATNRFDMLDDAILRPGRFDRLIEVPAPDTDGKAEIFEIHTREMNVGDGIDTHELALMVDEDTTGSDIQAICTEAGMYAIRNDRTEITMDDFQNAYAKVSDSREMQTGPVEGVAFA